MTHGSWVHACALVAAGLVAASACGSESSPDDTTPNAAPAEDAQAPDAGQSIPPASIDIGEPELVLSGAARLVDVTHDDHAVVRMGSALQAARLEPGAQPVVIADNPTLVRVVGNAVFAWSNVDYTTDLGELVVWSAAHGTRALGSAFFREGTIAASSDGARVMYLSNPTETHVDLMLADAGSAPTALITAIGRGSNSTCGPRFSFLGTASILAAWCQPESWDASLELLSLDATAGWQKITIATDGQSQWSTDEQARRIFFTSRSSHARVFEAGQIQPIDTGVAWGVVLPDGSGVLYVVGDQLRRTPLPNVDPTPIIPNYFRERVSFDSKYEWVLFSKRVTYEGGTRRDLWLSRTTQYNPNPEALVSEPIASMTRSAFTDNGSHVLWLTDIDGQGAGILHARATEGGTEQTMPRVESAIASGDSTIVFSDGRSAPTEHPVLADLKIVDLARQAPPQIVKSRVIDGRDFAVTRDHTRVVYSLPDGGADLNGLYVQRVRRVVEGN